MQTIALLQPPALTDQTRSPEQEKDRQHVAQDERCVNVMRLALAGGNTEAKNLWLLLLDPQNAHLRQVLQHQGSVQTHVYLVCDVAQSEKSATQRLAPALAAFYREVKPATMQVVCAGQTTVAFHTLDTVGDGAFFRSTQVSLTL